MRVAPQVVLTEDQERSLRQRARGRSLPARLLFIRSQW
jgi:hypothetical protein